MSRIQAALNQLKCDLLIKNVRVANVITGEIYPAEIAIADGTIVGVEAPDSKPDRHATRHLDGRGRVAIPGLIDSHLHIESSLVTPAPFAAAMLQRGITTVAEDPHEIANVAGLEGVRRFWQASQGLPLSIYYFASTCVPAASGLEHSRGEMDATDIAQMLTWDHVLGLAEVMDARAVVEEEPRMRAILDVGTRANAIIEGHNPMLRGRELAAYIVAGVNSDHTIATPDDLREKLRLGVTIQLQERYMTGEIFEMLARLPEWPSTVCLVTDDVSPDYLQQYGHLDHVVRRAMALGMPAMKALQAATVNPARRLQRLDRGIVAPGYRADIALVDSLESFEVSATIVNGEPAMWDGVMQWQPPAHQPMLNALRNSLHLAPLSMEDFAVDLAISNGEIDVRVIQANPGRSSTTTTESQQRIQFIEGQPLLDDDLCLIAVFARGGASRAVGFLRGLGLTQGAIATSHSHDSHNLTIIGRDVSSMVTAANAVIEAEGGIAVAQADRMMAMVPLPIAGVVSDAPLATVAAQMSDVVTTLRRWGIDHSHTLMRLSTFTLPVSSGLRITDMGYVRASERRLVPLLI